LRKDYRIFKFLKAILKFFYPKTEICGLENLPDEPCFIVGNHTQMHGPIVSEIYMPENCYTWCAGQMMEFKSVANYAYKDFWSQKPTVLRPFFKVLSFLITPISVCIFNNARTIAVHHDTRILSTFKNTIKKLSEGKNIIIFPEHDKKHNNIIYDFQNKFIDVARPYYKKTGKELYFTPLYIAPSLKKAYLGKPIKFNASAPADQERDRICNYLMNEITEIATSLPLHTVTPYRNIPKRNYKKNIPIEVYNYEETDSWLPKF